MVSQFEFKALVARKDGKQQTVAIETLTDRDLPEGDVTIDIAYSSFNYKDGMALKDQGRILRRHPIIPGIDFAGTVAASDSDRFKPGDTVILTGWGVGEGWSGGFAQRARVKSEWLLKCPVGITAQQAMVVGTAGLTAMLAVMALERYGITPGGQVLVTGAAGGVGSIAVRLLSRLGYVVTAMTGRPNEAEFLHKLGATAILDRAEYAAPGKPLAAERWAGAIDVVGGTTLANVLAAMMRDGAVAACGLAGGMDLPATVLPFILRGVALLGIDSVHCAMVERETAWERLAHELHPDNFTIVTQTIGLADLPAHADAILAGQVRGRARPGREEGPEEGQARPRPRVPSQAVTDQVAGLVTAGASFGGAGAGVTSSKGLGRRRSVSSETPAGTLASREASIC